MTLLNGNKMTLSPSKKNNRIEFDIANYFMSYNYIINHKKEKLLYLYENGVFYEAEDDIRNIITSYFDTVFIDEIYSIRKVNNIIAILKSRVGIYKEMEGKYINCCNGWLELVNDEWILHEHISRIYHEDIYFTPPVFFNQLPIEYIPKAESQLIDQIFEDLVGFKKVPIIYKMLSYFMMDHVKYQKAFLFYGPPGTGKTTFIDIIYKFLGRSLIGEERLQNLSGRWNLGFIYNKWVNIWDDLDAYSIKRTDIFRMLVTNNFLSCELKRLRKKIQFKNRIKLLYTCNKLPEIPLYIGDEFFRRWIILECINEKEETPYLLDKIDNIELSGLLNKILPYYISLLNDGFGIEWKDFSYIKNMWTIESNPLDLFISECCWLETGARTDYNEFIIKLNDFRAKHNGNPISKAKCTTALNKLGVTVVRSTHQKFYENIRLKEKVGIDGY